MHSEFLFSFFSIFTEIHEAKTCLWKKIKNLSVNGVLGIEKDREKITDQKIFFIKNPDILPIDLNVESNELSGYANKLRYQI